jgi:exosortase H (IPTLxxWG-CTERM-specific)
MVRFLVAFLVLLGALFGAQLTPWGQEYFVVPWTNGLAHFCAQLVGSFDANAEAAGKVLRSNTTGFAVSIEAGCNGVEATIVLLAAILAFPSSWKQKAWGLLAGFIAIQGLNVVRIISLFYIGQWNRTVFDWAHLHIWPALIIFDALIVFIVWVRYVSKSDVHRDGSPDEPSSGSKSSRTQAQPA